MTVRVFALDLKTFAVTHEIPFKSLKVDNTINGVGSWSLDLPVSFKSPGGVEILTAENFTPNRHGVAIVNDETPIMLGLFETEEGSIEEDGESLRIGGPELALGYLSRRVWLRNATYTNYEQMALAARYVDEAFTYGLPGMNYEQTQGYPSGVLRNRTHLFSERKTLYEMLEDLSAVENGFDFASEARGNQATGFTVKIMFGYPQLLRRTNFTLAMGKNIKSLSYARDGSKYANQVFVGGSDKSRSGGVGYASKAIDLSTYPGYYTFETRATVIEASTLQLWANKYLQIYGQTPTRYDLVVDSNDPDVQLGSFRVGDEFRMIAKRGRVDVDSYFRVESWGLSVDGDGREKVTMSMFETGTL